MNLQNYARMYGMFLLNTFFDKIKKIFEKNYIFFHCSIY